jgi:hypothetical protein
MRKIALAGLGIATAAVIFGPEAAADQNAFLSPSRNISCEIDVRQNYNMPDVTYCQSNSPPQSVHMSADGALTTCNGATCVGNPGIGTPILAYGQSTSLGPFTCASATGGITCTVGSGRGFTISSSGVQGQ